MEDKGITKEELIKLLMCVPEPLNMFTIECPQWYKDYMEKMYGKTNVKDGVHN